MLVHLLILNYNGRPRLEECLPSVLRAAACSDHHCEVAVIDNDSTDDSRAWLAAHYPEVPVIRRPNRGLCSFNDVVPGLEGPVAVLLNNDVSLDPHCIDPLVAPLLEDRPTNASATVPVFRAPWRRVGRRKWDRPLAEHASCSSAVPKRRSRRASPCFMTAPLCWRPDGSTYEGVKTSVCWRFGLVQATALFPGHEATIRQPGLTASAGAALAVDRRKFAELGGFDPLYLPGRLEDLDFAFRGYLAGYHARYVPQAVAYHRGMATFGEVFGPEGCERLALRNTLLFQWKNLRDPLHLARQLLGLPVRLARDVVRAPWVPARRRWMFLRAFCGALGRLGRFRSAPYGTQHTVAAEREFFRRFDPRRMAEAPAQAPLPTERRQLAGLIPGHVSCRSSPQGSTTRDRPTVTAAVITLNEERNLAGLLPALDWADQIVVVDGGSRDATVAVARRHGCRVAVRPFDTFARQRNHALRLATGNWVLSIDADERPTPGLVAEIRRRITQSRADAFRVPIRSWIFGRRLRLSGTQDDWPVRLFRRRAGRWTGDVHEAVEVSGCVGRLRHWLIHHTTPDLETFLAKMHRYARLEATRRAAGGRRPAWHDTWIAPVREIFRRLIYKQGLLDGPAGWAFCLLSGLSEWVVAREHRRLSETVAHATHAVGRSATPAGLDRQRTLRRLDPQPPPLGLDRPALPAGCCPDTDLTLIER
jgi:N-acetylglucosaminyl-diphospho-decaprenol L-rhamnosyltransferase